MGEIADDLLARNRIEKEGKASMEEKSIIGLLSTHIFEHYMRLTLEYRSTLRSQSRISKLIFGNVSGRDFGTSFVYPSLPSSYLSA